MENGVGFSKDFRLLSEPTFPEGAWLNPLFRSRIAPPDLTRALFYRFFWCARILSFDDGAIAETAYATLPHVTLTKSFLEDPERYLRQL